MGVYDQGSEDLPRSTGAATRREAVVTTTTANNRRREALTEQFGTCDDCMAQEDLRRMREEP